MFLGFIDVSVPPNAVRVILEGYIRVLETLPSASDGSMNMDVGETGSMGHTKLLALYTAALGENAVERYAQFLVDLSFPVLELHPLDAAGETVRNGLSLEERREALMKAKENGFEMDRVAIAVAERSIQRSFDVSAIYVLEREQLTWTPPITAIAIAALSTTTSTLFVTTSGPSQPNGRVPPTLDRVDYLHGNHV